MLFDTAITQEFCELLNELFPASIGDKALRKLIMYLAFGNWFNYGENRLSASQQVLAIIEGKTHELPNDNYVAYKFLQRARQSVLPQLEWSDYSTGKARVFLRTGFSKEFLGAIELERATLIDYDVPRVNYLSGKPETTAPKTLANRATKELRSRLALANELTKDVSPILPLQKEFLDYLNSRPTVAFTKIVDSNYEAALQAACSLPYGRARSQTLDMLRAIRLQPKPVYAARRSTVRLFAVGPSITYLKKAVRKALTKGWIEFDLQNAHLAIIAKDWNLPDLSAILANGSFWIHLQSEGLDTKTHKAALKEALYSLVYGASKRNIESGLIDKADSAVAQQFFSLKIIQYIFQAREAELGRIKNNSTGRIDLFGRELEFNPERANESARSILSQKAQAVELELMRPALEMSKKHSGACMMTIYQFDGFSIKTDDKRENIPRAEDFKAAIDNHVQSLGYQTQITYEVL